jgi:enoyl-CoA hydratase/carnithine racemase
MAFSPPSSLLYDTRDGKCFISLNRPEQMNALNRELGQALGEAIEEFEADDDLYVAILSGEGGRAFSAGADIKEMTTYVGTDDDPRRTGSRRGASGSMALGSTRKPVIAAIDGYCYAAGCELATMCDIRVATRASRFAIPEVKRSLIAGPGTIDLPRLIPLGEALLMALTGDPISAERAYQVGFVQRLGETREDMFREAEAIADAIMGNPPLAVQDNKHVIKIGVNMPREYASYFREKYFDQILQTEDATEGAAAFAEKRPPVWKGR